MNKLIVGVAALAALAGCGKDDKPGEGGGGSGATAKGGDGAKPGGKALHVQPPTLAPATPTCERARGVLGDWAECVEAEIPELASAAGKVWRVHAKDDPVRATVWLLARPDGKIDSFDMPGLADEIIKAVDPEKAPVELLAHVAGILESRGAAPRCLAGKADALLDAGTCEPPRLVREGEELALYVVLESFPHPGIYAADDHDLMTYRFELDAGGISLDEGKRIAELGPVTALPSWMPAIPEMSKAPDWAATPEKAPADVSDALCKDADLGEGAKCEAWAYPGLALPTGAIYYLSNDRGQRFLFGIKKPDGSIVTGYKARNDENPVSTLVASYDPAVTPPETFLAAHLTINGVAARIRCLPGDEQLPEGAPCTAPTAKKEGDKVVLTAVIEELPYMQDLFAPSEHAIRRRTFEFTPGGGVSSDGPRLVDLRKK